METMNEEILKMNIYVDRYLTAIYLRDNIISGVDNFIKLFMKGEIYYQNKVIEDKNPWIEINLNGIIHRYEFIKDFINWTINLNETNLFVNKIYELCGYCTFDINDMFKIFDECDVFCNVDVMKVYNGEKSDKFNNFYINGDKNQFINPDDINKLLLKRVYPVYKNKLINSYE